MFSFQGFTKFEVFKKWCHQESNRGHKDFQSFALKTFKSLAYGSTFKGNQLSYCTLAVMLYFFIFLYFFLWFNSQFNSQRKPR